MPIAVEFDNVSIVFGSKPELALPLMDDMKERPEIQLETGQVLGVHNCNLSVGTGEILVLMGLSGSGKSTLIRAVNALNPVVRGTVRVNDGSDLVDVTNADAKTLRDMRQHKVAMVFQQFGLLPWRTVRENVGLGLELAGMPKSERDLQVNKQLELVHLSDWSERKVGELSGGMQQRVGLARAFATEAPILLMDEPFSALDPLIRRQLQDEFIRLSKILKKTTVFITHDLDEAVRIGDRIAIMRDGKVVQMGTPEEIVMNPADPYVADFVAGISRLKVVHAHAVMQPIAGYTTAHGPLPADCRRVPPGETLSNLITYAIDDTGPILVADAGKDLGVITRADLLRTVIEGTEVS
jgi:glycine betaine/proline transport system ATP-binding protein